MVTIVVTTCMCQLTWLLHNHFSLAVRWGHILLVGIIWGGKARPLYRVEGWPRNRGFLCTIYTKGIATEPRLVSTLGRVVIYQGWSLRGLPLYSIPTVECAITPIDLEKLIREH